MFGWIVFISVLTWVLYEIASAEGRARARRGDCEIIAHDL